MFEMLVNPREAEKKPFGLFFVGMLYASLSIFLVNLIFLRDVVLSKYASLLIVTFTTMFSLPFMYYLIRFQEMKEVIEGKNRILVLEHGKAIVALLYLFAGFIVAFSFWYVVLPQGITSIDFNAQIEQYCVINMPSDISGCLNNYGLAEGTITGKVISSGYDIYSIFKNNLFVLSFVLIFSLAFGAGAIFILAWNAGVIAAAIGIIFRTSFSSLTGLIGYLLHGVPEIAAYFIAALAGGILSIAVIRKDMIHGRFWDMLFDFVLLLIIAIFALFIAALIEVFISPFFF